MSVSSVASFKHVLDTSRSHDVSKSQGFVAKAATFGQRLFVDRISFVVPALESVVNAVSSLAVAVLRTVWSATLGVAFTDKEIRDLAYNSFNDVVTSLQVLVQSIAGVILCPAVAGKVEEFFNKPAVVVVTV